MLRNGGNLGLLLLTSVPDFPLPYETGDLLFTTGDLPLVRGPGDLSFGYAAGDFSLPYSPGDVFHSTDLSLNAGLDNLPLCDGSGDRPLEN